MDSGFARRFARWLPYVVFLLLIGNLWWFIGISQHLGGGTLGGYVRDGHYFLANHGAYTEVDQSAWEWHRIHELTVLVGFPLAILGAVLLSMRGGWPWLVGGPPGSAAEQRIETIRHSGRPILRASPPLRLVATELPEGIAVLTCYPGGLIIELPDAKARGILRADVRRIEEHPTSEPANLSITHVAPDIASPVTVIGAGDSEIAAAIKRSLQPA